MKQSVWLFFLLLSSFALSSQGKVHESLSMHSKLLNTAVKYSVYLPEHYQDTDISYPVLYLLNGFEGDETSWLKDGNLQKTTDNLISSNLIVPMVIIMPDGDDRLYMNKDDGTYPYEDMFMTEFMPFIENTYRIKDDKHFRAISGLSMGGSGSLRWAFLYPNLFGTCAAFSAGISTEDEIMIEASESFDYYFGQVSPSIKGKKGKARLTKTIRDYDVLSIIDRVDPEVLKTINIYFDCGDDDLFTIGSSQLHIRLTQKNIPHEYRVRDGAHDWAFWRKSLPEGLKFISKAINSN